jgi:hypothetical protein
VNTADAVYLAENRGVTAALIALGAEITDTGVLILTAGQYDSHEFNRRLDAQLGRTS